MHTNKTKVIQAVWDNPNKAFGCQFAQNGKYWRSLKGDKYPEAGKIRLALVGDFSNIMVFYNGGSRAEKSDIFTYLGEYENTGDFRETLRALADAYGVRLEYSKEDAEKMRRADLAKAAAPILVECLRTNPDGETAQYIRGRGLSIEGGLFGELTAASLKTLKEALKARGLSWDDADLSALQLTAENARKGFNCVIPYYSNGAIRGLVLRNITASKDRYRYGITGRAGYCQRLERETPAVIAEGQPDAIALIQNGVKNVIAIGGKEPGEEIAALLYNHQITQITYIPDAETDERGERKTGAIRAALQKFAAMEIEGEKVIKSVLVYDLPTPKGANKKTDAADYNKENPGELTPTEIEFNALNSWRWELETLIKPDARPADLQAAAADIYSRTNSPFEREQMRAYVDTRADLAAAGITGKAFDELDELRAARVYRNKITAAASALDEEIKKGANPVNIAEIVRRLSDAQSTNTRADWDNQIKADFAADLREIASQPETLRTNWELGTISKDRRFIPGETIEFYPADICVFCAQTSHGKTAVLFQAARDLLKKYPDSVILYVSCEESKRQLTERALNSFIEIDCSETGKDARGEQCFIKGTRRKTLKAIIRKAPAPSKYCADTLDGINSYNRLQNRVTAEIERYGRELAPRLRFVHTEASAESITNNILHTIEEYRRGGVEVAAVFLDYVQLLTTDAQNFSRTDELKSVCKALKDCAARTEIPLIIAAQLNRETLRTTSTTKGGAIDYAGVVNIGEAADIERIAHDVFLIWQTDKTPLQQYQNKTAENGELDTSIIKGGIRSRRIFTDTEGNGPVKLKEGYLYIEQLKARDGITGGWGLLPFDGERGRIGANDTEQMKA